MNKPSPLDSIDLSDDSEDDKPVPLKSDSNKRSLDGADGENKPEEPVQELLRVKRARHSKPFTEDLLLSPNGLEKIYFEFPLTHKFSAKYMSEADYLKKLLTGYKEWAFQLHPGLSFVDALSKTETLGSKARVRNYMLRLRDKERERYTVSFRETFCIFLIILFLWFE
jgi:hypothetical protein